MLFHGVLLMRKMRTYSTDSLKPRLSHTTGFCVIPFSSSPTGDTVGGIPKCTISRIVSRVSTAFVRKQHEFIRWPSTAAERQEIKQGFFEKGGFPGVIGCIDGTHVRIQGPSAHESDFVNRKGFHSINVQAICDHKDKYRVLIVDIY